MELHKSCNSSILKYDQERSREMDLVVSKQENNKSLIPSKSVESSSSKNCNKEPYMIRKVGIAFHNLNHSRNKVKNSWGGRITKTRCDASTTKEKDVCEISDEKKRE